MRASTTGFEYAVSAASSVAASSVVNGEVSDFPETVLRLFRGENGGKPILKLDGTVN